LKNPWIITCLLRKSLNTYAKIHLPFPKKLGNTVLLFLGMIILISTTVLTAGTASSKMSVNAKHRVKNNAVPVLNVTGTVATFSKRSALLPPKLLMFATDVPKKFIADSINTSIKLQYQTKSIKLSWLNPEMELIKHQKLLNAWIPLFLH